MPSSRRVQLQGPKPPALNIAQDSHQIKKQAAHHPSQAPVIVYVNTPKIIHTRPQDFMSLVQRLTGKNTADSSSHSCDTNSDSSPEVLRGGVAGDGGDRDPLLLTLGQVHSMPSVPSPVSPGFFLCSPNTSACLQDVGLLF